MKTNILLFISAILLSVSTLTPSLAQPIFTDASRSNRERAEDIVKHMTLREKVSLMVYDSPAVERLGIKKYNWWNEALHGIPATEMRQFFLCQSLWLHPSMQSCWRRYSPPRVMKDVLNGTSHAHQTMRICGTRAYHIGLPTSTSFVTHVGDVVWRLMERTRILHHSWVWLSFAVCKAITKMV